MPVFKTEMQTINGAAKGCNCSVTNVLCGFFHGWVTTTPTDLCFLSSLPVCPPPTEPENGGYRCHPSPCHQLTQKTVIEYFCDEGFALKGGYRFLTCQNGEWDGPMQISCRLTQGPVWCTQMGKKPTSCVFTLQLFSVSPTEKEPNSPLGIPALSIVMSTASSVTLILLLVVLFVLVQPKLKSFHHSRYNKYKCWMTLIFPFVGCQVSNCTSSGSDKQKHPMIGWALRNWKAELDFEIYFIMILLVSITHYKSMTMCSLFNKSKVSLLLVGFSSGIFLHLTIYLYVLRLSAVHWL